MKKIMLIAASVLLLTFIADFFVHQHVKFGPEDMPGFYALFAFAGGGIILLAGWLLPRVIKLPPRTSQSEGQTEGQTAGQTAGDTAGQTGSQPSKAKL